MSEIIALNSDPKLFLSVDHKRGNSEGDGTEKKSNKSLPKRGRSPSYLPLFRSLHGIIFVKVKTEIDETRENESFCGGVELPVRYSIVDERL